MQVAKILGGKPLHGTVRVSGSKNSSLAILAATLLTPDVCTIDNIPNVVDVQIVLQILQSIGVSIEKTSDTSYKICAKNVTNTIPEELYSKTRGAISIAGALIARLKEAKIFLPGGCAIGYRPIDLHLTGFKKFGCKIIQKNSDINIDASAAHNATMFLGSGFGSTVTGTINMILAACGIEGESVIEGAACEPEVVDLCNFLIKIGVELFGLGTPTIKIIGNKKLHGCHHKVIGDRIEAGTLICAGLITGGDLTIQGLEKHMLGSVISCLQEIGAEIDESNDIHVKTSKIFIPTNVVTLPFPGFPTDLQAQIATLLTQIKGVSVVTERIYPNRFLYVKELQKLGANITLQNESAIINGTPYKALRGSTLDATDLRASASLYLAGLIAKGETTVTNLYHLDRGYDHFEEKLSLLGAKIERCEI